MRGFIRERDGRLSAEFEPEEVALLSQLARETAELVEDWRSGSETPADDVWRSSSESPNNDQWRSSSESRSDTHIETPADDPAMLRLLPDAYRDDAAAAAEFRRFTADGLAERKTANARAVVASIGTESTTTTTVRLDEPAVQAWLRVLTDIRLVLATRLGIEHDGDRGYADSDAAILLSDIYDWLGIVQSSILDALTEPPDRAPFQS
ncbi:MAG: hypothetical protein QOJ77_1210 [Microbacteriaceae bacterium]|nr:hypothetical protein [Microbacteriaceae bacterium]